MNNSVTSARIMVVMNGTLVLLITSIRIIITTEAAVEIAIDLSVIVKNEPVEAKQGVSRGQDSSHDSRHLNDHWTTMKWR